DYIVQLYKGRTDDRARQYQLGNFRTLRNLIHRAALIARADGVDAITRSHVELATEHGELFAAESNNSNQEDRIRETFRNALKRKAINMDEDFSWEELKQVTARTPVDVGYGFLHCCLLTKLPPSRGYYQLSEVQRALARGLTLNAWLGKSLSRERI